MLGIFGQEQENYEGQFRQQGLWSSGAKREIGRYAAERLNFDHMRSAAMAITLGSGHKLVWSSG